MSDHDGVAHAPCRADELRNVRFDSRAGVAKSAGRAGELESGARRLALRLALNWALAIVRARRKVQGMAGKLEPATRLERVTC